MLRIVPHTVPRVGRSYEHFPDGFELHLLQPCVQSAGRMKGVRCRIQSVGFISKGMRRHGIHAEKLFDVTAKKTVGRMPLHRAS